ncbi:facilitated trehalose transporter Tret1-like isoform X1 [Bombus vosnesenskii]|uniref:Facilitated trehalose transporter Tret1-like isoform X1 n=2 Tax=Pyrobombus TaxID=144703 RepID=A0A6J3LMB1_9HYME|nr:facilitated trehalose transporter Tret1-like isoform X1 [Bombus vancouverensis nearcticus]XP_033298639.1 facilitated trehalose transporter Tret1-like isoform X1 [Bombus bifarius]XP_033366330.1 facilitated trehalose transporter Tret1-like isoform X1 [Bombus vosnesenskii]XP_050489031.1 facilitated trehalose transporter Tret1-like isoform X1 [Bombus huntii]XP_050489032.1 facilitated trehalose transporter Tret1-like isoform X1 [Bombus huntii]XP_050489033.1 facilitated trehalose transporter Tret
MPRNRNYETFTDECMSLSEKNGDIQNSEKSSLVESKILPKIQSSNRLEDVQPMLATNNASSDPENGRIVNGSVVRQVLAAVVAQLGTINTGMTFGFSAIALPQLQEPNSTIPIVEGSSEESWIASMSSIGTPIGCLMSGYMMDVLGRKLSLIITEIPALLGWILIAFATNIHMIYAGRFFVGLGSGMVGAPARVYTGEVTQPHLRGMLTAFASIGVSTGVLIEYLLGSVLTWNICAAVSGILPLAALLLMFLFPETPSYLMSRSRPDKAREALQQFRGSTCNINQEMETLINFSNKNNIKRLTGFREIVNALLKPNAVKPFTLLFLYFLIYQWSGTNVITFYAVEIFQDSGATLNKYLAAVILGIVRLASTIVACILCKKCGRRPLTMVSSVGCGLSMIGLGGYMWLRNYWITNNFQLIATWFPVLCIFSYTITCTLGFLVIPWVMIGEVYPTQVRGIIGGLTTMAAHSFIFTVVKTYPFLASSITRHGTFILYGCISLFGTIYFYLCLPETKGKTLQEIEDYFSGRNDDLRTGSIGRHKPKMLEAKKGQILP